MHPIAGALCEVCGEPLASAYALSISARSSASANSGQTNLADAGAPLCELCRRAQPPYVKATAYGSYESGLRELIHLLKYDRVRPAANVLGRMLMEATADLLPLFAGPALVVPVPLHASKLRQRGFNQSESIARAALKLNPSPSRFELAADILQRVRETQSQIGLSRHQRRENMRGAFSVANPGKLAEREILLVDDVFTTGTTASECARVLRKAGAAKVYVATVARTLKAEAQAVKLNLETEESMTMAAAV